MARRTLLNIALAALVAAVAAALWLTPVEERRAAPVLVPGVSADTIDTIRVERRDAPELRFRRDGASWTMTAPVTAPAHEARINALLGLLVDQSLAQLPATELARFGLDNPAVVVELGPHRIALGDPHPIDEQRYVLYGVTVHLVPDSLYPQLTQNAGFFIDTRLLPAGTKPARIRYPAFTIEPAEGGWREIPAGNRDPATLLAVIGDWKTARALAVRTPARAAAGRDAITVETAGGAPIVFEILALDPAPVLARRDLDIQYHLDGWTAGQLLLAPPSTAAGPPAD